MCVCVCVSVLSFLLSLSRRFRFFLLQVRLWDVETMQETTTYAGPSAALFYAKLARPVLPVTIRGLGLVVHVFREVFYLQCAGVHEFGVSEVDWSHDSKFIANKVK